MMKMNTTTNGVKDIRVVSYEKMTSPKALWEKIPRTEEANKIVKNTRECIENIFDGKESRRILIVGPCSIHDYDEAREYMEQLAEISKEVKDRFLVLARVNVEKPRTKADWPGFLLDPDRDCSGDIEKGRELTRKLLLYINELGLPAATEFVYTITPQYIGDLISLAWVGARSVGADMHKRMASGLSMPVGFKNGLEGSVEAAVNAVLTAGSRSVLLVLVQMGWKQE